ncbi:hypothetical protein T03_8152 [Trichinella britovi]|uniref:Uncharacterized protein n=1 Tax=Trichinella britovi TaxID=45882 RepID=A0A0V1D6P6_TRIBR|nr:hypothetical protein T03_8152 [Trichinella britovi]
MIENGRVIWWMIKDDIRFWKVLRQINPYVSNKWPLKLPCAYLNTQESRHTGTPLKWNMGG